MPPLVSIIIPVYNAAKFLRETLDSVLAQSLRDWELICIDNGSSDTSPQILEEYAGKDSRVQCLSLPPVGAGAARNAGLDIAQGTYVCFCDSDDLLPPTALEHMCSRAECTQADLVIAALDFFNETGKRKSFPHWNLKRLSARVSTTAFCPLKELPDMLFEITYPFAHTKLFRRQLLNDRHIRFTTHRRAEDLPFSFLAAALAQTVTITDEVCYLYRQQSSSLSHNLTQEPHIFLDVLLYMFDLIREKQFPDVSLHSYLRAAVEHCLYHPTLMSREDARACIRKIKTDFEPKWHMLAALAGDPIIRSIYRRYKAAIAPEQRMYIDLSSGWKMTENVVRSIRNNDSFCAEIILLTQGLPPHDQARLKDFLQKHYYIGEATYPAGSDTIPSFILRADEAVAPDTAPKLWCTKDDSAPTRPESGTVRLFRICGLERRHDGFLFMIGHKCALRYEKDVQGHRVYIGRHCLFCTTTR